MNVYYFNNVYLGVCAPPLSRAISNMGVSVPIKHGVDG